MRRYLQKPSMCRRLYTILYNALVLLVDETFEQYDDENEWFAMIQNELGCTAEELKEYGIKITVDGGICELIKQQGELRDE